MGHIAIEVATQPQTIIEVSDDSTLPNGESKKKVSI